MSRYPAELEPISGEDYREAVQLAEVVVPWAEGNGAKYRDAITYALFPSLDVFALPMS